MAALGLGRRRVTVLQPWYWRSLPLDHRTGSSVFAALFLPAPGDYLRGGVGAIATLLESPATLPLDSTLHTLARYSLCAGAPRCGRQTVDLWTAGIGEVLPLLRTRLRTRGDLHPPRHIDPALPFQGGWLGWLGYDLAWEIETLPFTKSDQLPFPVAYWYEPEQFAILDHGQQRLWLAASAPQDLDQMERRLDTQPIQHASIPVTSGQIRLGMDQLTFEQAVLKAKHHIQAGDIFQTNLSLRFEVQTTADSWAIYQHLQRINPSPFASYWSTPWGAVVSCSPERLVQLQSGWAQTRPIAGTRSRGQTPEQDCDLAADLQQSTKENAEHIMLVDLERNDLGRVCQWGTVQVDELLTIERYSHVMHLVSNVVGQLRPGCDAVDLIQAMFPGGTITGCPKVRCMEIIEALEPVRRSLFYGSCGYLDYRGSLDLNILIRTLLCAPVPSLAHPRQQHIWGQVGAGIVADSVPEYEWHESLQKAKAQLLALGCGDWERC